MQTFKELVKSKGMTQVELVKKSGVSQRVITHWISGRNQPTLYQAYRVACALGVSLEDLALVFIYGAEKERGGQATDGL